MQSNLQNIRAIVNESIDFWLEYLSILKIFIEPDPANIFIFQISSLFKNRVVDTINDCQTIESKITSQFEEVKINDFKFYNEFRNELEYQLSELNKHASELFLGHEPNTIPLKRKFIVSYLGTELTNLEKLIRTMACNLPEKEIYDIDSIFIEKKKKATEVTNSEIPKYLLGAVTGIVKKPSNLSSGQFLAFLRNKAVVFLIFKVKDAEFFKVLVDAGEENSISLAADISSGDYSFIIKVMTSPKAKEEISAIQISEKEELQFITGNKEFFKLIYGYLIMIHPEEAKVILRKIIDSLNGRLPFIELIKIIVQLRIDPMTLNIKQI